MERNQWDKQAWRLASLSVSRVFASARLKENASSQRGQPEKWGCQPAQHQGHYLGAGVLPQGEDSAPGKRQSSQNLNFCHQSDCMTIVRSLNHSYPWSTYLSSRKAGPCFPLASFLIHGTDNNDFPLKGQTGAYVTFIKASCQQHPYHQHDEIPQGNRSSANSTQKTNETTTFMCVALLRS